MIMNVIPQREEKKYIRFFMGLLLILLVVRPLLQIRDLDETLEWKVLTHQLEQEYGELKKEEKYLELEGNQYMRTNCKKELESQITTLLETMSYEVIRTETVLDDGEEFKVDGIQCVVRKKEGEEKEQGEEMIKKKLAQVYNLSDENINVRIQE